MRAVVTGGAGFIGSGLVTALVEAGHEVVVLDDMTTGFRRHLDGLELRLHEVDILQAPDLPGLLSGADCVYHLAANADVRHGWDHPTLDLEKNVIATCRLAQAAVQASVGSFVFSSTGSVYGECRVIPTPEDAPFPVQTSLYGASKCAAEGFLAAYAEAGLLDVTVFRFVSVLGPRYSHGHVIDFVRQLRAHPEYLDVLGDGTQRKSYMHVDDCVRALMSLSSGHGFNVYNLGVDDSCQVDDSIGWIAGRMGVEPQLRYTGGDRGWVGDNPLIHLDTRRAATAGWLPEWGIRGAVEQTVDWLQANEWLVDQSGGMQ